MSSPSKLSPVESNLRLLELHTRVAAAETPRSRGLRLADLGEAIAEGPGSDALDEAIETLTAAREILPGDEPRRALVACKLGLLLARRHVESGHPLDRDQAIEELLLVLAVGGLNREQDAAARFIAGFLMMRRELGSATSVAGAIDLANVLVAKRDGGLRDAINLLAGVPKGALPTERLPKTVTAFLDMCQFLPDLWQAGQPDPAKLLPVISNYLSLLGEAASGHPEVDLVGSMEALLHSLKARMSGDIGNSMHKLRDAAANAPSTTIRALLHQELALAHVIRAQITDTADDLAIANEEIQRALEYLDPSSFLYRNTHWTRVWLRVTEAALDGTSEAADDAAELATRLVESQDRDDPVDEASAQALLGTAKLLQARVTGDAAELRDARCLLRAAIPHIDDSLLAGLVVPSLGALLSTRGHGSLADTEAGSRLMAVALAFQSVDEAKDLPGSPLVAALRGAVGFSKVVGRDDGELETALEDLSVALDELPMAYAWRNTFVVGLGIARMLMGLRRQSDGEVEAAVEYVIESARAAPRGDPTCPILLGIGGAGCLYLGDRRSDLGMLERARELLKEAGDSPVLFESQRVEVLRSSGHALLVRAERSARPTADLAESIRLLEEARRLEAKTGLPDPRTLVPLCRAQHGIADPAAIDTGLAALRAFRSQVLLQTGTEYGLEAARGAAELAHQIAGWCVEADQAGTAVEALELGRCLVLHSATTTARVPDLLRRAGRDDLASEWENSATGHGEPLGGLLGERGSTNRVAAEFLASLQGMHIPSDLRHRVLTVLAVD